MCGTPTLGPSPGGLQCEGTGQPWRVKVCCAHSGAATAQHTLWHTGVVTRHLHQDLSLSDSDSTASKGGSDTQLDLFCVWKGNKQPQILHESKIESVRQVSNAEQDMCSTEVKN